jgi:integrase
MSFLPPALVPNISGHVHRVKRKKGYVWYVKYRAPDPTAPCGRRQVEKALGPEWPHEEPPPPGYYARRAAQAALDAILTDARRGHVEVMRTGVTFERLAREWLVWGEHERGWKHSTLVDRRSCLRRHLIPAFAHLRIEQLTTPRIECWKSEFLIRTGQRRQAAKLVALLHSMYERAGVLYGLQRNPVAAVTRIEVNYDAGPLRLLLARGGLGARARSRQRAGRDDLPDRGLRRTAPRRDRRLAVARRRLR